MTVPPQYESAIGPVFDFLLDEMPDRMPAGGLVVDTYTEKYPTDGSPLFCVGVNFPTSGEAGEAEQAYVEIGGGAGQGAEETFTVPCYAAAGVQGSQKLARDTCLYVYNRVCALVAADVTLAGILRDGRWAQVAPALITATTITANRGQSRWCVVSFGIKCQNHYYPQ